MGESALHTSGCMAEPTVGPCAHLWNTKYSYTQKKIQILSNTAWLCNLAHIPNWKKKLVINPNPSQLGFLV